MPTSIEGAEYPILKIFGNDFVFSIPRYQRPYAWTTEHARELLDDLVSFMGENDKEISDLDPYFMGSIVLVKDKDAPKSEVVDGQQRLTTLTILLAALRETLEDEDFARSMTKRLCEEEDQAAGSPNRYRLVLRKRDARFFEEYVQEPSGLSKLEALEPAQLPDSQQRIHSNARLLLDELRKLDESTRQRLAQFIVQRCYLVAVSTPDLDSAYRIFSVLNDRGLDLSHTDILKAEVIGKTPAHQQDEYTKKWEDQEEQLGRDGFGELFAHIRMIRRKAKLRETILKEFREYVKPADKPQGFIDGTLLPLAEAFDLIKTEAYQSTQYAERINWLFGWLNQIDNFDWVPPAILYLSKHNTGEQSLLDFFTALERLAAGLMIRRANINERIERYAQLLTIIEKDSNLFEPDSPLDLTRKEREEIVNTLDGDIYRVRRVRRYVLLRLDEALSEGEASYNYRVLSVEHVLPQNPLPDSQWVKWFPTTEMREAYEHRLGNLVLLSRRKNSRARNYEFDVKKERYFTGREGSSPFALTTQVLREKEWTPEVLDRRQQELLNKLKQVWQL